MSEGGKGDVLGVRVGSAVFCAECFDDTFENIRPEQLIMEDDPEAGEIYCNNCQQPIKG